MDNWKIVPQSIRDKLRRYVFERDGWHCRIRGPKCKHQRGCRGCAEDLDHIVSRHQGGSVLDPTNCRASCKPCNRGRRPKKKRMPRGKVREW